MHRTGNSGVKSQTAVKERHDRNRLGSRIATVILFGLTAAGAGISQPGPGSVESIVQAHMGAARAAQAEKDYAGAAREYEAIVALQPANALIRQSLGVALHLAGQYPKAIRELSEAVRLDETLWGAYLFLGMDYYRVGRFEEAVAALERSLDLNRGLVEGRRWLGMSCAALGRFEEAIDHLSKVLESEERDEEALYQLARAYDNRATQVFETIGRTEPASPFVFLLQAERFAFEGEDERALSEYRRAVELRPDLTGTIIEGVGPVGNTTPELRVDGRISSAKTMYAEGRYAEVARAAKSAIETGRELSEARFWLGRAYKGLAKETLTRLINVAPDSYRTDQLEAEFHASTTEFPKALDAYQRALEKRPELPGLRYAIGVVHWRAGRLDTAVQWLEEELERNPHHTLARHRLGSILLALGRAQDAIPQLEAAVSADPASGDARFDLGRAYLEGGDPASAVHTLELVTDSEPSNERARFLLANAYRSLGRTADAAREIKAYHELSRERLRRVQRDVRSVAEDIKGEGR